MRIFVRVAPLRLTIPKSQGASARVLRRTVRTEDRKEHRILGRILRERRENCGLSQREVAKRLDRTQAFVWKVESGNQHIDIAILIDLAVILETEASTIVRDVETARMDG